MGINYKRVYLLEGLPGTGKTSLITALASKYDLNIGIFNFDSKTTDSVFSKMVKILPDNSALLLEDLDGLFQARKEGDINKNSDIDFWAKDLKNCLNNIDLVLVSGFILKTDSFPTCSRNYFRETYRIYQSRVNDKYVNFEEWISSHENISLNKLSINDIFPK